MKTNGMLSIYKAQPIGEKSVPSAVIIIHTEVPEFPDLDTAGRTYAAQAVELVTTLAESLPGGLFDALLVEMMRRKVTLFRIPHVAPGEQVPT